MTGPVDEDKRATLRRFAALGASAPIVGAATGRASAEENDTREAIVGYLSTTPGAHFSKLRDDLSLGTGETQYHLRQLEDAGTIESAKDGEYRRYYPAGRFDGFEKRALGYLRRETPRGILIALLRDPETTGAAIAADLGVSQPTVSAAVGDLERAGLLDRSDGYRVVEPERIIALLVRYADSFGADAVAFADEAAAYLRYDP